MGLFDWAKDWVRSYKAGYAAAQEFIDKNKYNKTYDDTDTEEETPPMTMAESEALFEKWVSETYK